MSLPLAGERIVIGHLFADLLNLYGDHGNIATLVRRAEWRGAAVEVREIGADQGGALATVDIIFIGGGQDAQQITVAKGLEQLGGALLDAVGKGAALLAVCGGYQNLGHRFQSELAGELIGPGLLDVWTEAPVGAARRVGGVVIELAKGSPIAAAGRASAAAAGVAGAETHLVGFENHSGRTYLSAGTRPLGRVLVGYGNNDRDAAEGMIAFPGEGGLAGLRIGTYLHGPLLPRNPHLADYLLGRALDRNGSMELTALPDEGEWLAHTTFAARWNVERATRRGSRFGAIGERVGSLIGF
jgi:CobQ-like glutamine amidotransferase family enzyme